MFVIDGYTDNGYFHFNFGWSGSGNGWFKLDAIKPYQGDDYSWKQNSDHYANFNLAPEGTTGIDEVKGENGNVKGENGNVKGESGNVKGIYDLTGRRLDEITAPGIYIVDGKKVLVK